MEKLGIGTIVQPDTTCEWYFKRNDFQSIIMSKWLIM